MFNNKLLLLIIIIIITNYYYIHLFASSYSAKLKQDTLKQGFFSI